MEKQSLLDEKQTLLDDIDDRQKTYNSENRRLAKQVERQKKHIKCLENCISNLKKSKLKNDKDFYETIQLFYTYKRNNNKKQFKISPLMKDQMLNMFHQKKNSETK